jgi:hypothetical protein
MAPQMVEAAVAAGVDVHAWPSASNPALSAVEVPPNSTSFMDQLRPAYALALAGALNATAAAALMHAGFDGQQFGDPALLNDDAWALLVLEAAHSARGDAEAAAVRLLAANQGMDGGWSWHVGGTSEVDLTGMVMRALSGQDAHDAALNLSLKRGAAFLAGAADSSGGFPITPGGTPNCDSSVWAVRGFWAAGTAASPRVFGFLASLRQADGSFAWKSGGAGEVFCTAEVVALLGDGLSAGRDFGGYSRPATSAAGFPLLATLLALALPARFWVARNARSGRLSDSVQEQ